MPTEQDRIDSDVVRLTLWGEDEGITLPYEVARFLAQNRWIIEKKWGRFQRAAGRDPLRGAFVRVIAFASLTGQEISIKLATEVLWGHDCDVVH